MIDPKIHNQLRERFSPDGSEIRDFQLRLIEILEYIDRICKKHDIKYWASSGTCLGAIRHGGFIPWDDDADIEMLRSDYKRFRKAVLEDKNPRFILHDHSTDPEYIAQFAKIADLRPFEISNLHTDDYIRYLKYRGPFVDIFVMAPSNSRRLCRFSGHIQGVFLFRLNYITPPRLRKVLKHINYILLRHIVFPFFRYIARPGAKDILRHIPGVEYPAPRNIKDIGQVKYVPFEHISIPVPEHADAYLSRMFGDYMKLPDPDKIETHNIDLNKTGHSD